MTEQGAKKQARQARFLKAYRIAGTVTRAAAAAKIDRSTHYEWMEDPEYREAFNQADMEATGALEDECIERAMRGVYEPLVYQGAFQYPQEQYEIEPAQPAKPAVFGVNEQPAKPAVMGWRNVPGAPPIGVWKKSDSNLQFLLRGKLPEKYRQGVEVTGANGGPVAAALTVTFVKPA